MMEVGRKVTNKNDKTKQHLIYCGDAQLWVCVEDYFTYYARLNWDVALRL